MLEEAGYNNWGDAEKIAHDAFEMYETGEMTEALSQLKEAISINAANSSWHFNAGLTLDALNRFEEAIESYQQALDLTGDDPEILNIYASNCVKLGDYERALIIADKIGSKPSGRVPAIRLKYSIYSAMGKEDEIERLKKEQDFQ